MSKVTADRVTLAEHSRQIHRIKPEVGTNLKDMLVSEYWAHVAAKFHTGDKLEIFAEDGSWYAELLVVSCSRIHAKVLVLLEKQIDVQVPTKQKSVEPFYHAYRGASAKHSVLRTSDKAVVKEGFESREAAIGWLAEHQDELTA